MRRYDKSDGFSAALSGLEDYLISHPGAPLRSALGWLMMAFQAAKTKVRNRSGCGGALDDALGGAA